jgi:hypothetical protein
MELPGVTKDRSVREQRFMSKVWMSHDPVERAVAIGLLIVSWLCAAVGLIDWAL